MRVFYTEVIARAKAERERGRIPGKLQVGHGGDWEGTKAKVKNGPQ